MALTLTITIDDADVERYIEVINELNIINDVKVEPITLDMLNQNPDLQKDLALNISGVWEGELDEAYEDLFE